MILNRLLRPMCKYICLKSDNVYFENDLCKFSIYTLRNVKTRSGGGKAMVYGVKTRHLVLLNTAFWVPIYAL